MQPPWKCSDCSPESDMHMNCHRTGWGQSQLSQLSLALPSELIGLQLQVWLQSVAVQSGCDFFWFMWLDFQTLVIASLHGINTAALLQSWSVMVSIESYPCDIGNLVMKSNVTVSKGIASGWGNMGCSGALVGRMLILCLWQSAHPFMYSITSLHMFSHPYLQLTNWLVLLIPGCPYTGESWWVWIKVRWWLNPPVTTHLPSLYHVPLTFFSLCMSIHGLRRFLSCVYTRSYGSISSWDTICHSGGAFSIFMALANTHLGNTITLALSCSLVL